MNAVDYFFSESRFLDKDVIVGPKEILSYPKAYADTIKLAGYFQEKFGEDQKIILLASNSVFFVTAYLAIMKSGNVCIPLNPSTEESNLKYIKEITGSDICMIQQRLEKQYNLSFSHVINEQALEEIYRKDYTFNDHADFDRERLAQIIFTSGSTAHPKGVMLSHKNLIANTESIIEYLKLTKEDIIHCVLPFYYCYGLSLLHTHMRVGGALLLDNSFMFLGSVINNMKKYKCTGFSGVPSHFQILLRKSPTFKKTEFPDLKYVTQAGGKLHKAFIKEFTDTFPDISFYVMYGQTEATARLSYLPPAKLPEKLGSIGKGIPEVTLQVLNEKGEPIKPGETGEIVAEGENVMSGYFNDEQTTKETLKNGKLYTGDLATVDEDGYIFLTARKKEIIKVGGKRVSPKEIEEVIVSMPGVVDCTISAFEDEILGEALKAEIVKSQEENLTVEEIKKYCGSKLAIYKVPQVIEFVENMTVSSTGKKVKASM